MSQNKNLFKEFSVSQNFLYWFQIKLVNTQARFEETNFINNLTNDSNNAVLQDERGKVISLKDGIATVIGVPLVKSGEIVYIDNLSDVELGNSTKGLVLNLNADSINVIILGNERLVSEGYSVKRSKKLLTVDSGLKLFGRVSDAIGNFKDEPKKYLNNLQFSERAGLIEKKATGIIDREPVNIPLRTGIKAVDSLVPIGRGQRELIIGDRQTGKSSIAVDIILNHVVLNNSKKLKNEKYGLNLDKLREVVWFVYAGVGQKQSTISGIQTKLTQNNALWFTSLVAATASESAPLQFLTPYTACAVGEFIRDVLGGHCTVIYDDLSKHAVAYRQMSLLLRRPPGREAFPGDVFYVHSRLLERAGALNNKQIMISEKINSENGQTKSKKLLRGTLTAFPIIETQAGDVSAYIPTNVISITDGQIFLETELFYRGIRPAVNVGLSVSRVGSAAQPPLMKRVSGPLKMELAQFREIESFAKLGANLDDHTLRLLTRGENIIEILKQDLHAPITMFEQTLSIFTSVGYSQSWLNEILKLKKIFASQFLNLARVRISWLEFFRLRSQDFQITDVRQFVNALLNFSKIIGMKKIMESFVVEQLMNFLITKCPFIFFDDIIYAYLFETGAIKKDSTKYSLNEFNIVIKKTEIQTKSSEIQTKKLESGQSQQILIHNAFNKQTVVERFKALGNQLLSFNIEKLNNSFGLVQINSSIKIFKNLSELFLDFFCEQVVRENINSKKVVSFNFKKLSTKFLSFQNDFDFITHLPEVVSTPWEISANLAEITDARIFDELDSFVYPLENLLDQHTLCTVSEFLNNEFLDWVYIDNFNSPVDFLFWEKKLVDLTQDEHDL